MNKIKRALVSVSDKTNLKVLLEILKKYKVEIISTGGTYKEIKKLKYNCIDVAKFTGSSEILNGRVKTLHPKIYAGILNKRNDKSHKIDLKKNNYKNIDLIICNFYPFETILNKTKNHKKILENIDIGGPSMVRSAAKNYRDVVVITSTNQYEKLIEEMQNNGGSTSLNFRKEMSLEAFSETAYYDAIISNYLNNFSKNFFTQKKVFYGDLVEKLRYGENPHQSGYIYVNNIGNKINQIHGKQLSYNNYNDILSALSITNFLPKRKGTVIVKHTNPCGVSIDKNNLKSFDQAFKCDPISSFGGVVACNFKIKKNLAKKINNIFIEVIIGKSFDKDAIKLLKKKKNLRIIDSSKFELNQAIKFNSIDNYILVQNIDKIKLTKKNFKVVSKKKPTKKQMENLMFAFNVCRFVKSNSIVLASDNSTVGIGSGQPSRIDSCQIAINKMKSMKNIKDDIVAASDAFFPFVDGIQKLVQSGVSAIIQPHGSIRDKEIIKFANQTNTVLIFSKTRHFNH